MIFFNCTKRFKNSEESFRDVNKNIEVAFNNLESIQQQVYFDRVKSK